MEIRQWNITDTERLICVRVMESARVAHGKVLCSCGRESEFANALIECFLSVIVALVCFDIVWHKWHALRITIPFELLALYHIGQHERKHDVWVRGSRAAEGTAELALQFLLLLQDVCQAAAAEVVLAALASQYVVKVPETNRTVVPKLLLLFYRLYILLVLNPVHIDNCSELYIGDKLLHRRGFCLFDFFGGSVRLNHWRLFAEAAFN